MNNQTAPISDSYSDFQGFDSDRRLARCSSGRGLASARLGTVALVAAVIGLAVCGLTRPAYAQVGDIANVFPTVEVYYDLVLDTWQADFGYINTDSNAVVIPFGPPKNVLYRNDLYEAIPHPQLFNPGTFADRFRVDLELEDSVEWFISENTGGPSGDNPHAVTAVAADGIGSVVRPGTIVIEGDVTPTSGTYTHTATSNPLPLPNLSVWDGGTLNVTADLDTTVVDIRGAGVANVLAGAFTVDTFLVVDTGGVLRAFGGTVDADLAQVNVGGRFIAEGGVQDVGFGLTNFGEMVLIDTTINGGVNNRGGSVTNIVGDVVFNGNVTGPGAFFGSGTATFNGSFAPGASPAKVGVEGSIAFGGTNTLEIELAGIDDGEFDRLEILGDLTLDGLLDVALLNSFALSPNQQFEILNVAGALTGQFLGLGEGDLVGNFSSTDLFISYTAGDGNDVALFTAGLPGDFDLDGDVDGRDFLVWQRNPTVGNLADWQTNYGASSLTAASVAVPEPTTLLLLGSLSVLACVRRH